MADRWWQHKRWRGLALLLALMATDEGNEVGLAPPLEKAGLHPWRWEVEAGRSHLQGAYNNEDVIASADGGQQVQQ